MLSIELRSMIAKSILWLSIVAICTPVSVFAQLLEEIVVTAKKREENLQDVSVSVTAFSSETLSDIGLTNSNDLGQYIPGVEVHAPSGNQQFKSFIRGSGAVDFAANTQTTVGIYVDEVYMHNTFMHTMQTFDLERIEVLRGPQGTLYGRNATGGAINFITAKPTEEFSGYVKGGYGNDDAVQVEGAVSGSITDNLNGRVSAIYNGGGGWMSGRTNIPGTVGGDDFNETDFYSWRGMLEWTPQDNVNVLWTVNGSQDKSDAFSYQHAGAVDPVTFGLCDATVRDDCIDFFSYQDPDGIEERGDPNTGDFDLHDQVDYETLGTSLRVEWDLENFSVTSITAWNKFQRFHPGEEDGSPNELSHNFYTHDTDGWSQELRATSTTDGPWDWIVGFYYAEDDLQANNTYSFFQFLTFQEFDQKQDSIAVFGNVGYQLNEQFKVSLGLRYTDDSVSLNHRSDAFDPPPPIGFGGGNFPIDTGTSGSNSYDDLGWKVGIDYTPNDDWLIYATVGTGYKSGGINVGFGDPSEFNIYDKETLLAVEGGFKSTLMDGRARLNVSGFYYDYEDLQIFDQFVGPFGSLFAIGNAPSADYYGFEAEFLVNPLEGLDFMFSVSHLSAEFNALDRPITGEDLTGNSNVYSPPWKFIGLAKYDWETPSLMNGRMSASFNWSWTDEMYHSIDNVSAARAKKHWLIGARASWYSQDESIELAVWGKNLSDTYYRVQSFDFSAAGWWTLVPNRPRSFGGEIIYSW